MRTSNIERPASNVERRGEPPRVDVRCSKLVHRQTALFLAAMLAIHACRADVIVLANGRSLRGIIQSETDNRVVLDLGVGSTRIERTRIAAVRRESAEQNEAIRQEWRKAHILHRRFVPPAMVDLSSAFNALSAQRDTLLRARRASGAAERTLRRERAGLDALQEKLIAVSRTLKDASPHEDTDGYNRLVHESNALRAELTLKEEAIQRAETAHKGTVEPLAGYVEALAAFREEFGKHRIAAGAANHDEQWFLDRLELKMAEWTGEVKQAEVPTTRRTGGIHVAVRLNDRVQGTMILDTGATLVSISDGLARRLGIDRDPLPIQLMTVADGRKVEGRAFTLDSVRVGDACLRDVPAIILPAGTEPDFDGLLGMSFLRHFAIRIDGATGNLVLSAFVGE